MARLLRALTFLIPFLVSAASARELDKLYTKTKLAVGPHKITVWIADDDSKREQGLMYIDKMSDDVGMLFVFEEPRVLSFWMKNTVMPLAIAYVNDKGVVIDIQEMSVPAVMEENPRTYKSLGPALFALEMNTGWFKRRGVRPGAALKLAAASPSPLLNSRLSVNKISRH